jgi:hypothetical protein
MKFYQTTCVLCWPTLFLILEVVPHSSYSLSTSTSLTPLPSPTQYPHNKLRLLAPVSPSSGSHANPLLHASQSTAQTRSGTRSLASYICSSATSHSQDDSSGWANSRIQHTHTPDMSATTQSISPLFEQQRRGGVKSQSSFIRAFHGMTRMSSLGAKRRAIESFFLLFLRFLILFCVFDIHIPSSESSKPWRFAPAMLDPPHLPPLQHCQ